jgi:hypothetical protein
MSSLRSNSLSPEIDDSFDRLAEPNALSGSHRRNRLERSFLEPNGLVVLVQNMDRQRAGSKDTCKQSNARRLECTC